MKNQFKRSLSLLMAVLMILSCWVWVAPEKAEAWVKSAGNVDVSDVYEVEIVYDVANNGDSGKVECSYVPNNGTGTETGYKEVLSSNITSSGSQTFSVTGWPKKIKITTNNNSGSECDVRVTAIKINGVTVFSGKFTVALRWLSKATDTAEFDASTGKTSRTIGSPIGKTKYTQESYSWPKPAFAAVSAATVPAFEINKLPNGGATANTVTVTGGVDQYGVKWSPALPTSDYTYTIYNGQNTDGSYKKLDATYGSATGTGSTCTASINPAVQKLFPKTNINDDAFKVGVKYGENETIFDVTLKFPKYTISLNPNGGSMPLSLQKLSGEFYYGANIMDAANLEVLPGFKFAEDGSGKIEENKEEINKDNSKLVGWYSEAISDNGFNPTASIAKLGSDTTVDQDRTFYAYWETADIDVIFETADGQPLGSVVSKYAIPLVDTATNSSGKYDTLADLNTAVKNNGLGSWVAQSGVQVPAWAQGGMNYSFAGWKIYAAYDMSGNSVPSLKSQGTDAVLQGKTIFRPVYVPADKVQYTINFYKANGSLAVSQTYNFGAAIQDEPDENTIKLDPTTQFSYAFVGWAEKLNKAYYTVDENNLELDGSVVTYIPADSDFFYVDGNCDYVPVFKRTVNSYEVTYKYQTGVDEYSNPVYAYHTVTLPYGTKIEAPSADDVTPYFDVTGYRYNLEKWTYNGVEISADTTVIGPDMVIVADYADDGIPTMYKVNFYDQNNNLIVAEGEEDKEYKYGDTVTFPTVAENYDDDDYYYTFTGWSTSAKRENAEKLTSITVEGSVDFYATYAKKAYADVSFYDHNENLIYKVSGKGDPATTDDDIFVGDTIPAFAVTDAEDNVITVPSKPEDKYGKYTFFRWEDKSGNPVVPGASKFTGDIELYAKYNIEYTLYPVVFKNDNGDVIDEAEYKYGEKVVAPDVIPTKEADAMYEYAFKSWSPDVSEKCIGAATYTATYIRGYKYYTATWFGVPGDDGVRPVIKVVNYVSEERAVPVAYSNPEEAESGYGWVLTKWVRCDADYNLLDAEGKIVTDINAAATATEMLFDDEDLYFYPVFEKQENTYTVTFAFEGKVLGTVNVKFNQKVKASDLETFEKLAINEAAFLEDNANHYNFESWNVDLANTAITGNLTVIAITSAEAHNCNIFAEVVKAPTFTEGGKIKNKCNSASCKKTEIVDVDPLNDTVAPAITVSIGSANGYVNGLTEVYALVKDANDPANLPYWYENKNATSLVNTVEYYVAPAGTVADVATITGWNAAYSYDAVKAAAKKDLINAAGLSEDAFNALADYNKTKLQILNNLEAYMNAYEANVGTYLRNLVIADGAELTDGASYVVYVKATDRTGKTSYGQSAVITYGSTAPVILVSGDGFGTKYCSTATIAVTDDSDVTVTLNDSAIALDADGKYTCSAAGRYTVTAKDKNGNVTTKTFEIEGKHSTKHYTVIGTCTVAGSEYDLCERCGVKSNETVTAPAGHKLDSWTEVKATCLEDGYRTYKCTACKDVTVKVAPGAANMVTITNRAPVEGEVDAINAIIADKKLDLSHLDAKGTHTWPTEKVKDENGNETEVDVWVIDTAATCSATGTKHRNCTVCGLRDDDVVEIDPTAHKLQRKTLTKEADCTTEGEYTRKCKYCPYSEVVENIPALGHIAGEYEIIKPSTCEETGSKILKCGRCEVTIGEPVDTPALGHRFVVDNDPYKVTETDSEGKEVEVWYQDYKCANKCGETKTEKIDDLTGIKDVTVKFVNGTVEHKSFIKKIGETITAEEVPAPTKETDEKATYKFAYWATKDAEGNYSKIAFPVTAKEDVEYYAVFTETARTYSLTYKVDGEQYGNKIGYLRHGDEITVKAGPKKAADATNVYTFSHWAIGAKEYKAGDKITVTGNIELEAVYTTAKKSYYVMYGYTKEDVIATVPFEAGSSVTFDTTLVPEVLVKPDAEGHTVFTSWAGNAPEEIKSNVYAIAQFEQVNHSFETVAEKSKAATCTEAGVTVSKCSVCGYEKTETLPALGHNLTEGVYDAETGITEQECQRTGCDYKTTAVDKFTVIFNVDGAAVSTLTLDFGTVLSADLIPADPKKTAADKTYTFKGWNDGIKTYTAAELAALKLSVKADAAFNAVFEEKTIEYTVTFLRDSSTVYAQYTVSAGGSVTYDKGITPTKNYDQSKHYTFSNWKGHEDEGREIEIKDVNKDMLIYADFTAVDHVYPEEGSFVSPATCKQGSTYKFECACGHSYEKIVGSAKDHELDEKDRQEAGNGKNGYIYYECKNCDYTETKILKYETIDVTVTVYFNDAPKSGIKVEVQSLGGEIVKTATTNVNGEAKIAVGTDKAYVAWVEIDGEKIPVSLTTDSKGNYSGSYSYDDYEASCSCACHRDNLWGNIFRFFHKIIKLFTGEFKCCGNPDELYGA